MLKIRLGTLSLEGPKFRPGNYSSGFMTPRKTPLAVIQQVWSGGVSTRRVDELARAMCLSGMSMNTVSKLCVRLGA